MSYPNYNDDPYTVASWIRSTDFPTDPDEEDLLYDICLDRERRLSAQDRYALTILYWQVVGWLRK